MLPICADSRIDQRPWTAGPLSALCGRVLRPSRVQEVGTTRLGPPPGPSHEFTRRAPSL
jgi:hypothetical protein